MKRDEELLRELKRLSEGLFIMSESDYPFEILYLDGKDGLSYERLRELAGSPSNAPIETRSLEDFSRSTIYYAGVKDGPEARPVESPESLFRLLKENLRELRVYRIGEINIPVYIIGQSAEGNWIGLSTRVIET